MKKKNFKTLVLLLVCICLCGCHKEDNKMYHNLKKVTDYLYEIDFNDYRYDSKLESITNVEDFGCSSVKNGNYYGRNFDFVFNDVPEFVVKVKGNKKRHASIGVTFMSGIHEEDNITDKYMKKLELLPNFTLDGINDKGVICSDNVVPKTDVVEVTGTNPEGEKLHMGMIVRYVLDNADSADHAIKLLKEKNIYGNLGEHYNLHFMIADKDKTYILEFIDNIMIVKEKKNDEQIMTNYYVNLDYYTENAGGIERYNILKEHYNEGNSFKGMWKLLQRVQFSKAFLFDNENEWYSDYMPQSIINGDENTFNEYLIQLDNMKKEYWVARTYDQRNPSVSAFWITTHNSTYDINKRKLRVTVQEKYDKYYEYTLNK